MKELTLKERPIICSGWSVRQILAGLKTKTRRVVRLPCPHSDVAWWDHDDYGWSPVSAFGDEGTAWPNGNPGRLACPYGRVGHRLWVRETWNVGDMGPLRHGAPIVYRANYADDDPLVGPWRPSIHMPRWASRIDLEITGVRVERLRDISETDAEREGVTLPKTWERGKEPTYRHHFAALWDEINAKRGHSWVSNPWVWVLEFYRIKGREETMAKKTTGQQVNIKETLSTKNRGIENAAANYVEKRDERMAWTEEEKQAKTKLIAAMKKAGETHYETEDWVIDLTVKDPTESVKVKQREVDEEAAE